MNMNMNKVIQQAQKMQNDLKKAQEEIEKQTFTSKQELVEIQMTGDKKVTKVILNKDITSDDIEILEDMITIAVNDNIKKIDKTMEEKLGKFGKGIPGLF